MLKIRRPLGRLIFNMGIAIPGKTVFLIETAPRPPYTNREDVLLQDLVKSRSCESRVYFFFNRFEILQAPRSAAAPSRCLSNFKAIRSLKHPISRLRAFTRFGGKAPVTHWCTATCRRLPCDRKTVATKATAVQPIPPFFSCQSIGNQPIIRRSIADQLGTGWRLVDEKCPWKSGTSRRPVGDDVATGCVWLPLEWRWAVTGRWLVGNWLAVGWRLVGDLLKGLSLPWDKISRTCQDPVITIRNNLWCLM